MTGLKIPCIIGIFDWERRQKQDVVVDLSFPTDATRAAQGDRIQDAEDYKKIAKAVIEFVGKSKFHLIETLAERLSQLLLTSYQLPEINLKVSKPGAVRGSQNVGVEITRKSPLPPAGLVYLSLGSNIQPLLHLQTAMDEIHANFGLKAFSHVYETSPVGGKKGQPHFWNMVVAIETGETPLAIRRWINRLEKKQGRVKNQRRYLARTLDVDLILWKDQAVKGRGFVLPHPDIWTKAFVLFPLLEISPQMVLPGTQKPLIEIAHGFKDKRQKIHQLRNLPPSTFRI